MKKYLTVFAGVFLATTGLSASNSFMDQLHLIESLSPKDTLISQQQLDTLHEELKDTKAKLAREKVKLKFAKSVLEATNPATLLNTLGGTKRSRMMRLVRELLLLFKLRTRDSSTRQCKP